MKYCHQSWVAVHTVPRIDSLAGCPNCPRHPGFTGAHTPPHSYKTTAFSGTKHQGPVSWRPTTFKWRQFSRSNRHSTIGTRQTEYHEALSSANDEMRCDCTFADDGNASWYSVCRVPMVEWWLDCENCCHLTVVGLHDTGPRSSSVQYNYMLSYKTWRRFNCSQFLPPRGRRWPYYHKQSASERTS